MKTTFKFVRWFLRLSRSDGGDFVLDGSSGVWLRERGKGLSGEDAGSSGKRVGLSEERR